MIFKNKPIFILGNNRSGTSLLRIILTMHPNIIIPPESHFFLWLKNKYENWNLHSSLNNFLDDLYNSTKFETWNIDRDELQKYLINTKPGKYSELISSIYIFFGTKKEKKIIYWGDKNSLWIEKLDDIIEIFPDSIFIHIVRDGRDIACSYRSIMEKNIEHVKYSPNLPTQIAQIATIWKNNVLQVDKFLSKINAKQQITIRYEDLILNTEQTVSKILDLISLKICEECFNYYNHNVFGDLEPSSFKGWKEKIMSPPDPSNIGKYKNKLTNSEIEEFNKIANKALSKYYYL